MDIVKIGIIGVGGIAQGVHIPQILNIKEAKITAICDIDEQKLQTVGDKLSIPESKRYIDYMDLIRDEDVEAVDD